MGRNFRNYVAVAQQQVAAHCLVRNGLWTVRAYVWYLEDLSDAIVFRSHFLKFGGDWYAVVCGCQRQERKSQVQLWGKPERSTSGILSVALHTATRQWFVLNVFSCTRGGQNQKNVPRRRGTKWKTYHERHPQIYGIVQQQISLTSSVPGRHSIVLLRR